jgi:hypothetical protein
MSILDSLMELDPIKVFKKDMLVPVDFLYRLKLIRHKIRDLRGVEGFEPENKPWDSALPPSMELGGQGNLLSEEHHSGPTKLVSKEDYDRAALLDRYFSMSDM